MVTLSDKLNAIAESEATAKQTQPESKEIKMNVVKVEKTETKPETKTETKPETHEATTTTESENNNGENNNLPDDAGDNDTKGE